MSFDFTTMKVVTSELLLLSDSMNPVQSGSDQITGKPSAKDYGTCSTH